MPSNGDQPQSATATNAKTCSQTGNKSINSNSNAVKDHVNSKLYVYSVYFEECIQRLTVVHNSNSNAGSKNFNASNPQSFTRNPQCPYLMCIGSQFDGVGDEIDTTDIDTLI